MKTNRATVKPSIWQQCRSLDSYGRDGKPWWDCMAAVVLTIPDHIHRLALVFGVFLGLAACGGGGSSSSGSPTPPSPPPTPAAPTTVQLNMASKMLAQATFGQRYEEILRAAELGPDAWLNAQFTAPIGLHTPVVDTLVQMQQDGELPVVADPVDQLILFRRYAWWNRTLTAEDVLRQRVAFALSEIFVVSDNVDAIIIDPYALSTYQDTLLTHAFGNFRELLEAVTLHPTMGIYLSHVNNARANLVANTFPDENYAREVMQLFSIGLFELNSDGSQRLAGGSPIPTYDNDDIREMAKIFTGLSYGGVNAAFGNPVPNFREPMQMFEAAHEPGEKSLLDGVVVPAGQDGLQDVADALDNLFNHPNVGPFIGKQLIQRLVTSNPTPGYVSRVSAAFDGVTTGVRGDMRAVIRAVLTDPEAQIPASMVESGRLREPLVRYVSMLRQLGITADDGLLYNDGFLQQFFLRQHAYSAPSVFNFFLPSHTPPGALASAGLVAPEFQITDSSSIVSVSNIVDFTINGDFIFAEQPPFDSARLDYSGFVALAEQDLDGLLDRVDLVFTQGELSSSTRTVIHGILSELDPNDALLQAKTAIYLVLISPDYAVVL